MKYCDRCGAILCKDNNKLGYAICDKCNDILVKEVQERKITDCISRYDAVRAFDNCLGVNSVRAKEILIRLPSVTPTERKGHWIDAIEPIPLERCKSPHFTYKIVGYKCSECGATHEEHRLSMIATMTKYCPNCGANMEVNNE